VYASVTLGTCPHAIPLASWQWLHGWAPFLARCSLASGRHLLSLATDPLVCAGGSLLADAPFPPPPFRDGAPLGHTRYVGSGGMERCATALLARCPPARERHLPLRATDPPACAGSSLLVDAPLLPRHSEMGPSWVTLDVWAVAGWRGVPRCS